MNRIVGIVGATGNVGRKVVEMILRHKIVSPDNLRLFSSLQSAGQTLNIAGSCFHVHSLEDSSFQEESIFIFNTNQDISEHYIPKALSQGVNVIDSSSHYRLHADVPLIVPPVNGHLVSYKQKIHSHANCLASPMAIVLNPLHKTWGLTHVHAVTYQSTSGAGKGAMDECWFETKSVIEGHHYERFYFEKPIAFNIIPQVGAMQDNGYTLEEYKIIQEVRKVIGESIAVTATAVRVPVMIGHSIALSIMMEKPFEESLVIEKLNQTPFIRVMGHQYATPCDVVGYDDVFVGRIRRDLSVSNGLHLWLCSDNLCRGAATDAVEILALLQNSYKTRVA